MKLGLGIICFDASEHLYNIISEIRDLVDYVVIGVQKVSYHGDPIDNTDLYEINRLKEEGLVDKVLFIETDLKKFPRVQETDKRNQIIDDIASEGCTHELIIDSDEYYVHDPFMKAKKKIEDEDIEMSYCRYVNYYHDYMHYLVYPYKQGNYVPFIAKVKYKFEWQCTDFPKPSDPTRRFVRPKTFKFDPRTHKMLIDHNTGKPVADRYLVDYYEFPWKDLKMHHFSWIRYDIRKKLNDWSSKTYFKNVDELIDKAVARFNRPVDSEGEQAILLFNTPGNKVDIAKFPRQFVFPKVDIRTRVHLQPNKKKIIFLSMSCNKPEFIPLEDAVMNSWAKPIIDGKHDNMEFYIYVANKHPEKDKEWIDEKNHKIYVNTPDTFERTYSKSMHAFKLLKAAGKKYDYIVRTNTSTYVNVNLVDQFISKLTDDSIIYTSEIEACFWSKMYFYGQGSFLIMSDNVIRKLIDFEKPEWEEAFGASDDVMFGATLNNYYLQSGFSHRDYLKSVGLLYNFGRDLSEETLKHFREYLCIRTKTELDDIKNVADRKYDIAKFYKLDTLVKGSSLFIYDMNRINTEKAVWIGDKKAWVDDKDNKYMHKTPKGIWKYYRIPYEEAVERQKKLGIK